MVDWSSREGVRRGEALRMDQAEAVRDGELEVDGGVEPPDEDPEVVCLCGSTKFKDAFRSENARLTLEGKIVLSVGFFHHTDGVPEDAEGALDESGEWKRVVDHLHLRKIDLADRVHVINVDGYVGESTSREIAYARRTGTPVTWLVDSNPLDDLDEEIDVDELIAELEEITDLDEEGST